MRNHYNKTTTIDLPMETSFNSLTDDYNKQQSNSTRNIRAIGKKAKENLSEKVSRAPAVEKRSRHNVNKYEEGLQDLRSFKEHDVIQNEKFKHRRNAVIIILLTVLLALAIAGVATYIVITKLETNCYMHVSGARATYIVDGKNVNEFRAPSGIEGKRILELEIKLKIKEFGKYNIKFTVKCYMGDEELSNVWIAGYNADLFKDGEDGYCYSREEVDIKGGQTILLCRGIVLDDSYEGKLNSKNFRLDFYTDLDKIVN